MAKKTIAVKAAIIGLNRQTASIGLALREATRDPKNHLEFTVMAHDYDDKKMKDAAHFECVDSYHRVIPTVVDEASIVFVSLPYGYLAETYEIFGSELKPGAVVLDMSPIKTPVLDLVKKHFPRNEDGDLLAYCVGIYPLVNNEWLYDARQNIELGDSKLFRGGDMIIAPSVDVPREAIKLATDIAEVLKMLPHFSTPPEFDALANFTDVLPGMVAALMFAAMENSRGRVDLERTVNPTFGYLLQPLRETRTRDLADSWWQNREMLRLHLERLIAMFGSMRKMLEDSDSGTLHSLVEDILMAFDRWEQRRTKGSWDEDKSAMDEVSKFGLMGALLGGGLLSQRLKAAEDKADKHTSKRR